MENYEGFIGAITVSVLRSGLKPSTTIQLVVSLFYLLPSLSIYLIRFLGCRRYWSCRSRRLPGIFPSQLLCNSSYREADCDFRIQMHLRLRYSLSSETY